VLDALSRCLVPETQDLNEIGPSNAALAFCYKGIQCIADISNCHDAVSEHFLVRFADGCLNIGFYRSPFGHYLLEECRQSGSSGYKSPKVAEFEVTMRVDHTGHQYPGHVLDVVTRNRFILEAQHLAGGIGNQNLALRGPSHPGKDAVCLKFPEFHQA
jgi:hypothetical protein